MDKWNFIGASNLENRKMPLENWSNLLKNQTQSRKIHTGANMFLNKHIADQQFWKR